MENLSYKGVVRGETIILEEKKKLPEGTKVVIMPVEDVFLNVDEWAVDTGISDLAQRHDFYASGVDAQ